MGQSNHSSDPVLIRRFVQERDEQAFVVLVTKYKDLALSVAISVLKDRVWAEDVVQESFVKVYHALPSFRQQSNFKTWFYRIVINTSYNERKRKKVTLDFTEIADAAVTEKTTSEPLRKGDQKRYINLALDQLKPDEALVLRLFYLLELSIKEIVKATGFSKSKIKVDLHRGRHNLLQILQDLLGPEIKELL